MKITKYPYYLKNTLGNGFYKIVDNDQLVSVHQVYVKGETFQLSIESYIGPMAANIINVIQKNLEGYQEATFNDFNAALSLAHTKAKSLSDYHVSKIGN